MRLEPFIDGEALQLRLVTDECHAGFGLNGIQTADFNGDGRIDIFEAGEFGSSVYSWKWQWYVCPRSLDRVWPGIGRGLNCDGTRPHPESSISRGNGAQFRASG